MNCPSCKNPLGTLQYEGIEIGRCADCGGDWLDADELGQIVRRREVKFDEKARRAIAESTTITGVKLEDVDRNLVCPKCGDTTDAFNYGGDTGLILDRCVGCKGLWLDEHELEKVQQLVEGWEDLLPDDLVAYGPRLRDVEVRLDAANDVSPSRIPLIGRFINSLINGILDVMV